MPYILTVSPRKGKKFRITHGSKYIDFGARQYEDFTIHNDVKRKHSYLARHEKNEDWKRSGRMTAGFWSRWLLWNLGTIERSIEDIERRFIIEIIDQR